MFITKSKPLQEKETVAIPRVIVTYYYPPLLLKYRVVALNELIIFAINGNFPRVLKLNFNFNFPRVIFHEPARYQHFLKCKTFLNSFENKFITALKPHKCIYYQNLFSTFFSGWEEYVFRIITPKKR